MSNINQEEEFIGNQFPVESYMSPVSTKRKQVIPGAPVANKKYKKNKNNILFLPFPSFETNYIANSEEKLLDMQNIDLDTKESIKQLKKFIDNIKDHNERKDIINKLEFYLN
jgi:hypothetical protein